MKFSTDLKSSIQAITFPSEEKKKTNNNLYILDLILMSDIRLGKTFITGNLNFS